MKNRKDYPPDWHKISNFIRFERAKGKCEDCGRLHKSRYWNGQRFITIILTTAHLGIDKPDGTPGSKRDLHDVRPENLKALCQRCHLLLDADQHAQTRQIRLRKYLREAKQLCFHFWSES
mgnify:CR=1 FL=1